MKNFSPETDHLVPWFLQDGNKAIGAYLSKSHYVIADFETTNLDNGLAINPDNQLVLACWTVVKDGTETDKYKFGDEYDQQELLDDINEADFFVAQNSKFELQWLDRCGLDTHDVLVYDTMTAEWVIQGNKRAQFNLDAIAARYGLGQKESMVSKLIKQGVNPADIPRSWLLPYCQQDVELTHDVMLKQFDIIDKLDLWHIVLQRNIVIPVLADIELQGLHLDPRRVAEEEERLQSVIEELGEQLDEITGGINLGSPKQLAKLLYEDLKFAYPKDNGGKEMLTPGGDPSTSIDALAKLKVETKEQQKFLDLYKEYNFASSALSKNVSFFKKVCDQKDGKFFGQLNHCRTVNHRLASSGVKIKFKGEKVAKAPQIQNLPRKYKPMFTTPDDDYVVTEYDGSQIEFRVAADEGHDEQAESDIVNGVDIHSFTRDTMNAAYLEHGIRKEIDRQGAKPQTFAPLYGAFGKDAAEQAYAVAFRKKYHGIHETQQNWALTVADKKQLITPYGLIFYWPHAKMHNSGYVSYSTEIFNLPISGLATAEIIPLALAFFWHRSRETRTKIWNTVHDSIIVLNHKEEQDYVTEIAKQAMTLDVYKFLKEVYMYDFKVPLGLGMKTGTHWGESKEEFKWDVWPDGNERLQVERDKKIELIYDTRRNK